MLNGVDILTMVWHEVVKAVLMLAGVGVLLFLASIPRRRKCKDGPQNPGNRKPFQCPICDGKHDE